MAELVVIYDPERELGAIINVDTREALPCAMAGEHAQTVLQAFIDSTAWDLSVLSTSALQEAWWAFLDRLGVPAPVASDTAAAGSVEPPGGATVDESADALREAQEAAGAPPAPAPADTDMDSNAGSALAVVQCFNCHGTGTVQVEPDAPVSQCNMCHGTGRIEMPLAS